MPKRGAGPRRGLLAAHLVDRPLALLLATACATSATASFMAYHFHDLSPYVLIGNPLTLTVIEFFAVPGALIGAALYPLGLDAPVWLYVGAGIKFILWAARFIADAPGSTLHLRAFAPYALPFLALAVMSATIWRTWTFRASAIPLALIGLIGATHGPRYDVIVAPWGDLAAVRDADGALEAVGKRFNAFAAEQWLTADGDARDAAQARDPNAPCDRLGCVAALPEGQSLSIVVDRAGVRRGLRAGGSHGQRADRAGGLQGEIRARRKGARAPGAVGLTWSDEQGFTLASDRSALQDRPWSPAPEPARDDRLVRPGQARRMAPIPPIRATRRRRGVRFCARLQLFQWLGHIFLQLRTRHLGRGDKITNT